MYCCKVLMNMFNEDFLCPSKKWRDLLKNAVIWNAYSSQNHEDFHI